LARRLKALPCVTEGDLPRVARLWHGRASAALASRWPGREDADVLGVLPVDAEGVASALASALPGVRWPRGQGIGDRAFASARAAPADLGPGHHRPELAVLAGACLRLGRGGKQFILGRKQAAEHLGVPERTARDYLRYLKERGWIVRADGRTAREAE